MMKPLLTLSALSLLSLTAYAQKPPATTTPSFDRRKLAREAQEVQSSLKITDAQKAKLKAIDNKYQPKLKALRAAYQKERDSVYTPEQKAKLDAFKAKLVKELAPTKK